jgi:hypothetical protein
MAVLDFEEVFECDEKVLGLCDEVKNFHDRNKDCSRLDTGNFGLRKEVGGVATWIGNDLVDWEEEFPQRDPIVDLGFEAPSLQGRDDLLGNTVLGIRAAAVKRHTAHFQLA